jgi:hypothetical protein
VDAWFKNINIYWTPPSCPASYWPQGKQGCWLTSVPIWSWPDTSRSSPSSPSVWVPSWSWENWTEFVPEYGLWPRAACSSDPLSVLSYWEGAASLPRFMNFPSQLTPLLLHFTRAMLKFLFHRWFFPHFGRMPFLCYSSSSENEPLRILRSSWIVMKSVFLDFYH